MGEASWQVVITVVGSAVVVVGSLIVLNLRSIKECVRKFSTRIDKQDGRIEKSKDEVNQLRQDVADRRARCYQELVSKEDWLRSEGFAKQQRERVITSLNKLEGKLTVVERLPEISGNIAKQIVKEMRNGG